MSLKIGKSIDLYATPSRVWRALTDYREFGDWFGVALEGPFVAGGESVGRITHPGYEHLRWRVVVERMEPEKLFSFRGHPTGDGSNADDADEPSTLVEFRLTPAETGTLLEVTESGFETLPAGERDDIMQRNDGGWAQQVKNIRAHVGDG